MGKKGAKRKTRWRTLSIGTPPGEEDEEEGAHNGYAKPDQEHRQTYYRRPLTKEQTNGYHHHHYNSNSHNNNNHNNNNSNHNNNNYCREYKGWHKSRHGSAGSSGSGGGNSTTSGYASGGSRSRGGRDGSGGSPPASLPGQGGQSSAPFNQDEYTKITTPRQDMLFKKGYLSQRKSWFAGTASTSATPSTTESQSASQSTADVSEAAEDQQLLDSGVVGEYTGAGAPTAHQLEARLPYHPHYHHHPHHHHHHHHHPLTYYDPATGYYYEYPAMMLMAPAIPADPSMLAAVPCAPVPLRPIEWVNPPSYTPKLATHPYCYYQAPDCAVVVDAQGVPLIEAATDSKMHQPVLQTVSGLSNDPSLTGSASASLSESGSGSIAEEPLVHAINERQHIEMQQVQEHLERLELHQLDQIANSDQQQHNHLEEQLHTELEQHLELSDQCEIDPEQAQLQDQAEPELDSLDQNGHENLAHRQQSDLQEPQLQHQCIAIPEKFGLPSQLEHQDVPQNLNETLDQQQSFQEHQQCMINPEQQFELLSEHEHRHNLDENLGQHKHKALVEHELHDQCVIDAEQFELHDPHEHYEVHQHLEEPQDYTSSEYQQVYNYEQHDALTMLEEPHQVHQQLQHEHLEQYQLPSGHLEETQEYLPNQYQQVYELNQHDSNLLENQEQHVLLDHQLPAESLEPHQPVMAGMTLEQHEDVIVGSQLSLEAIEYTDEPYQVLPIETLPAQPLHLENVMPHHQQMAHYIYPGQYMFGPPVVNVNGMTIQSGTMFQCNDMVPGASAPIKRRRKKRKQKRAPVYIFAYLQGNKEEEEDEDNSSVEENGLSSRAPWSVAMSSAPSTSQLNPECQEFHPGPELASTMPIVVGPEQIYAADHYLPSTSIYAPYEASSVLAATDAPPAELAYCAEVEEEEEESAAAATTLGECAFEASSAQPMLNNHADNESIRLTDSERLNPSAYGTHDEQHCDHYNNSNQLEILTNGAATPAALVNGDSRSRSASPSNGDLRINGRSSTPPRGKFSVKLLANLESEPPTPGPDLVDVTTRRAKSEELSSQASQKNGDVDIRHTWVNECSIGPESCCNENSESSTTTTLRPTSTPVAIAIATTADEDSGFGSQSKVNCHARPITDAVNEWLKRANSPDLFVASSTASDNDDDDAGEDGDGDASVCNEPSKNLQGNPMPALSVNGGATNERKAKRGKIASSNEPIGKLQDELAGSCTCSERGGKANKIKAVKTSRRRSGEAFVVNTSEQNSSTEESNTILVWTAENGVDGICGFTEKDSDVGVRVAEKSRTTLTNLEKIDHCKLKSPEDSSQLVKTFEKGEIVVSLDGELLRVASKEENILTMRLDCNSSVEEEQNSSLGSIEEPDVLECWEAETIESLPAPATTISLSPTAEHMLAYYRLHADPSVDSRNVAAMNNDSESEIAPSGDRDDVTGSICSEDEVLPAHVPEVVGENFLQYNYNVPIDEAFEVYESCYTGEAYTFASIDSRFDKTRLFNRDEEGAVPCKAVCCNIQ